MRTLSRLTRRTTLPVVALLALVLAGCTGEPTAAPGAGAPAGGADAEPASEAPEPASEDAAASEAGAPSEAAAAADGGAADPACAGATVRVGITNSASDAPLFLSEANGYFEQQGLTVELTPFDSAAQMIAPLGGGQLDIGAGAPSAGFYNAVARDLNLRIVADKGSMPEGYGYMPLMVRKDLVDSGEFDGVEDLAGRRVAEPAQATATSSTLSTILASAGLSYDDVEHQFVGFAEHPTAFENGAIDASLTTEPAATVAERAGTAVRFATPPDFYDNQQLAVVLYSGDFIASQPEVGACFMTAYLQGVRDYVDALEDGALAGPNADEVIQVVTEATGLDPDLYAEITPNYVDPNGAVNRESLQKDYDFFAENGFLEGEVDLDAIVDPSFAEAAVERLGPYE